MCSAVCASSPQGHWSVSPTLNVLYKCCFSLLWFVLSLNMTTCSCLSSWLYASTLLYFGCSNFHFRLRHDLMIVFSSEYVVVESFCSRCAPCLARVSASSFGLKILLDLFWDASRFFHACLGCLNRLFVFSSVFSLSLPSTMMPKMRG